MAIDTAEKRRSVAHLYTGITPVSPTPNVAKDIEWRQQAGWGYSGINGAPAPAAAPKHTALGAHPTRWMVSAGKQVLG